jgi:hypothetical protein
MTQMDNYEEQGLELAKEGVKELLAPVTDILRQLLGSAATEVGLSFGDSARVWRLKRAVKLLEKVRRIADEAGLELKTVTPRLLFPILEAGLLEDDESMQNRWAALLANNAAGTHLDRVYPEILRQLSAADAQLLRMCLYAVLRAPYNRMAPPWSNSVSPAINEFMAAWKQQGIWECQHVGSAVPFPTSDLSVENLTRLGLLNSPTPATRDAPEGPITLSRIAFEFAMACEEPAVLKTIRREGDGDEPHGP